MKLAILFLFGLSLWQVEAANVAIPASQTACKTKVTFPVKPLKGLSGYPWYTEAFGIKVIGTQKAKSKLSHVAAVISELFDNDSDGCVDDPNIMNQILARSKKMGISYTIGVQESKNGQSTPAAILGHNWEALLDKKKMSVVQYLQPFEVKPECLKAGKFTGTCTFQPDINMACAEYKTCIDSTSEEMFHVLTEKGFSLAYPKQFSESSTTSTLALQMDKARGKRILTPVPFGYEYPAGAWYKKGGMVSYAIQVGEYIHWGYCAFVGLCEGLDSVNEYKDQFTFQKKADLKKGDKYLYDVFQASANKTASYRLPTIAPTGTYKGCKKCLRKNEISYDGQFYAGGYTG